MYDMNELPVTVNVDGLPLLATAVAIAGAEHRDEVGGSVCFSNVVAAAVVQGLF